MDSTATAILHPPGVDVEFPPCTAEDLRQNVQELVAKNDIPGAVVQCEELEILTAATPFGEKDEEWMKIHLTLLLVLDDVNNGRHLWRRLPASAKAGGGELSDLWGVGKCLWKRDIQGAQAALRGREWSPPIAGYVSLLRDRLWERQLDIISRGFNSLPLERVATLMGSSVDEAEKECAKEGWEVQAGTVKPKPRAKTETILSTTPDYLNKMARHITFLERQNQG